MRSFDIAVIGGGASGLAAAINAKRTSPGSSAAIIERLPRTGKKILATGNGRCNLSNVDLSPDNYSGTCKEFIKRTSDFSVTDFFMSLGVICESDSAGRIYPRSHSAASVLDALRLECSRLGVEEICGLEISGIDRNNVSGRMMLAVKASDDIISAKRIILAGGGMSQPALGSNGSLLGICKALGIKTIPAYPALVPLMTDPKLVKPLKGQRADANVVFCANGKGIKSIRGEVQFTDGLVSGICVFDLSHLYELYKNSECELRMDLLPDISRKAVRELLLNLRQIRSYASTDDYLSGIFTRPLGIYVLKRALGNCPELTKDIDDRMIDKTVATLKSLSFPVTGTAGYERSQITGGGIVAEELRENFEFRKIKGLYACGELLDICGQCGGYNLDFAFSSGALAGKSAASDLLGRQ